MKRLLLIAVAMAAGPVSAEWTLAIETDQTNYYVDNSTFKIAHGMRQVWVLRDNKQPSKYGDQSSTALFQFDCAQRRYRTLRNSTYTGQMATGRITATVNETQAWSVLRTETPGGLLTKIACNSDAS